MKKEVSINNEDGSRKTIAVEEIQNGFLVVKTWEYEEDDKWKYETKKWYSKSNPLEDVEIPSLADSFMEE